MLRTSFRVGLRFLHGQMGWTIRGRHPNGKIQLQSDAGELLALAESEINHHWLVAQDWLIDEQTLSSLQDVVHIAVQRDLTTFADKHQQEAKRRLQYLQAIDPANLSYCAGRWRERIQETAAKIGDLHPPAPSTVHGWWQRYRDTKSILSLIPRSKPSVGPTSKVPYRVFEEALASVYLTRQKLPKYAVVEAVFRRIDALNVGREAGQHIKRPSQSTIYRWLDDLHQDLVDKARDGAEATRIKYRAAIGNLHVGSILERIEIDHTPLDLLIIDCLTKLPLGRPWLTLAIDQYSKMVVGFYVSFNPPSSHAVLQCLRAAILPKDDWLARFPDIKGIWPASGIPELIAADNGMELHSEAFETACLEMGIQVLFCGSKTPQHKGSIERFFRTMNMGLIHRLPGTVFSCVDQRGDYPAEEKAVIDMQSLVHLLTKWVVEVYNVTVHRGIQARPLDRWLESADKRIIEYPVYPQQLEVITGIPATRTLFHYGIELDGLQYNSELLQTIRRRSGQSLTLQLKYYEDTVAYIHVFDPFHKEYIKVPAKLQEYAENLPRDIHRLVREHARKRFGEQSLSPQLLQARAEIEAIVQDALKQKKMGSRKAGAGYLMHDSLAVLEGKNPLELARTPLRQRREMPPDPLPSGLDDDLPDFLLQDMGDAHGS